MTCQYLDLSSASDYSTPRGRFASTNQKHYPDLGSDTSSVWNFCARFSDVISREISGGIAKLSAVFSGYEMKQVRILENPYPVPRKLESEF